MASAAPQNAAITKYTTGVSGVGFQKKKTLIIDKLIKQPSRKIGALPVLLRIGPKARESVASTTP